MPKLVTVVGATGIQGGSVIDALLPNPSYTLRALTRNPQSAPAQKLRERGIEVIAADTSDESSLRAAFAGSHAIFAATNFFEPFATLGAEKAGEIETAQGINLAKAAAATESLEHYVWSTLPNAEAISGGRISVAHFAAKNRVDDYIKSDPALLAKTTFLWIGYYASNIAYPWWKPVPVSTAFSPEQYVQLMATPPSVQVTLAGDVRRNVGLFVKAALQQPKRTRNGRVVLVATEKMTAGELLQTWARVHGKTATYAMVDKAAYQGMWPVWGELMNRFFLYLDMTGDKAFAGDEVVLGKDELGVEGLIGIAQAFAAMEV